MFNINKRRLDKIVKSDKYKNSGYRFEKVNNRYGIKHILSGEYVDLKYSVHKWPYGSTYTSDCFGSISTILRVFKFLCPIIEPINVQKVY